VAKVIAGGSVISIQVQSIAEALTPAQARSLAVDLINALKVVEPESRWLGCPDCGCSELSPMTTPADAMRMLKHAAESRFVSRFVPDPEGLGRPHPAWLDVSLKPPGWQKPPACTHPECDAVRDIMGCIACCPMCGKNYANHPECAGCDSPDHDMGKCPLIEAYDRGRDRT